jgi:hypothetical protein
MDAIIDESLNEKRCELVKTWAKNLSILDIGIGCGTFIKKALTNNLQIFGYDINQCAINWLHNQALYYDPYKENNNIKAWTFWDSLEHIPNPQILFEKISLGSFVFVSLPIFQTLEEITQSKHYRPNEHYYYFTTIGFLKWMYKYNFKIRGIYDFEIKAGRDNIKTFVFEKIVKIKSISALDFFKNFFEKNNANTDIIAKELLK